VPSRSAIPRVVRMSTTSLSCVRKLTPGQSYLRHAGKGQWSRNGGKRGKTRETSSSMSFRFG
jgi:hypothetical protein